MRFDMCSTLITHFTISFLTIKFTPCWCLSLRPPYHITLLLSVTLSESTAENTLSEITKWNNRILIVNCNGNPKTTIIIHYSPCEGRPNAEEHYEQLLIATSTIPKHNVLLTIGDFNAHISECSRNRYTFHNTTNTNGKLVKNSVEEANMKVVNTNFRKRLGKLWTFMSDVTGLNTCIFHTHLKQVD